METLTIHKLADWRSNEVYVLREDLLPFACGGNKARISSKLTEDAKSKGADVIVGYGNCRSNLCRALAMLCARERMGCTIISPSDDDGGRKETANSRIVRLCGAKIVPCEKGPGVAAVVEKVMNDISAAGGRPYYVFGNSKGEGNERILASPYEEVAVQISAWEQREGISFDRVAVAVGTGSTYAGFLNGFHSQSRTVPVTGFTIAREKAVCLKALARFTRLPADIRDNALAGGYGLTSAEQTRFLADVLTRHAILFDPVYSGKALWGLYDQIQTGTMANERILFVHTGSLPLAIDGLEAMDG